MKGERRVLQFLMEDHNDRVCKSCQRVVKEFVKGWPLRSSPSPGTSINKKRKTIHAWACCQYFLLNHCEREIFVNKDELILTVRAARSTLLRRRLLALTAQRTASKHRIVFILLTIQLSLVNLEKKHQQTVSYCENIFRVYPHQTKSKAVSFWAVHKRSRKQRLFHFCLVWIHLYKSMWSFAQCRYTLDGNVCHW